MSYFKAAYRRKGGGAQSLVYISITMNKKIEYIVRVPITSCSSASEMCEWTKEHKIECVWRPLHTENAFGRGFIVGFNFVFVNEEDAIAFKLRWL